MCLVWGQRCATLNIIRYSVLYVASEISNSRIKSTLSWTHTHITISSWSSKLFYNQSGLMLLKMKSQKVMFVNKWKLFVLNCRELGKPTSGKWIVRWCERPEIKHDSLDKFSKHAGHNLSSRGRVWWIQHPSAKEKVTTKARPSADLRSRHFTSYCFRKTSKSLQNLSFNPKTSKEKGDNKTFTLIPCAKVFWLDVLLYACSHFSWELLMMSISSHHWSNIFLILSREIGKNKSY